MPAYKQITSEDISFFVTLLGQEQVKFDAESLENYAHDETEDYIFVPELVLTPSLTDQVSEIMK